MSQCVVLKLCESPSMRDANVPGKAGIRGGEGSLERPRGAHLPSPGPVKQPRKSFGSLLPPRSGRARLPSPKGNRNCSGSIYCPIAVPYCITSFTLIQIPRALPLRGAKTFWQPRAPRREHERSAPRELRVRARVPDVFTRPAEAGHLHKQCISLHICRVNILRIRLGSALP